MAKVLPTGTDIQIATDAAFMSVVIDDEGGYKTSRSFTRGDLPYGVNLYARIRHTHPQAGTSYWSPTIRFKVITPASAIGVCLDNTDTTKKGVFYWIDAAGNKVDSFNFQNHPTYAGISMATLDADRAPVTMTKIPLFYIKTAAAGPVDSFAAGKKCWWLSDAPLPGFRPAACFKRSTETDANGKKIIAPYCYVGTYLGQQETVAGKNCIGSKKSQTIVSLPKATADQYIANRNVTDGKLYAEDVFSTYLYTGNNSTQTINNGIDLAGKGGLVWIKNRIDGAFDHTLTDTSRGAGYYLNTNTTSSQQFNIGLTVDQFNNNGFQLGADGYGNANRTGFTYASWTFRRAPKFFDIVTWTGDGVAGRRIPHGLGVAPGMIVVKRLDSMEDWGVWSRGDGVTKHTYLSLNKSDEGISYTTPTQSGYGLPHSDTTFNCTDVYSRGFVSANSVGSQYVAYIFAHDPSPNGMIQCGSFTTDASGNATVNLGWEPQWVLCKSASTNDTVGWVIADVMRNWDASNNVLYLKPNTSGAEAGGGYSGHQPTSTGFQLVTPATSTTYIYLAIRRPNKPPTSGTEVYNAIARVGTNSEVNITGVGFPPDMVHTVSRAGFSPNGFIDRLRGGGKTIFSRGVDNYESDYPTGVSSLNQDGVTAGTDRTYGIVNLSVNQYENFITHFFRRAPGFFDIVCDTGTGSAHAINHNLTVAPELIIRKSRSAATQWECWHSALAATEKLVLNSSAGKATDATAFGTLPTATQFYVGASSSTNASAATYVTYLFATCPGVSKVFSFTGNGASLPIDCGFTTGARFVLIKRTDDASDWFVWDSVRGITLGKDPHLSLNQAADEVITDDAIDPWNSGFIVKQNTATNVNVSGGEYIGLAIA